MEELGSDRKNIRKYTPYYYDNCEIDIAEKFVLSITCRNVNDNVKNAIKDNNQSDKIYT
jgi:hypothetical protein